MATGSVSEYALSAIFELPFSSLSKRVQERPINSYEHVFRLHVHLHANHINFYEKAFARRLVLKQRHSEIWTTLYQKTGFYKREWAERGHCVKVGVLNRVPCHFHRHLFHVVCLKQGYKAGWTRAPQHPPGYAPMYYLVNTSFCSN